MAGKPKHGHSSRNGVAVSTPTYLTWKNMIARCTQASSPAFEHYKKRGITVCDRWRSFANFLADMGERPPGKRRYTLERLDNNKGYEPGNCGWATWRQQGNNRVTNFTVEYQGRRFTLADLARHTGVSKETLRSRLCRSKLPWTVEGAVNTPILPKTMSKAGFCC